MLLPGLSSERIAPAQRLMFAIALTVCLFPVVGERIANDAGHSGTLLLIAREVMAGLYLGFLVRIFYLALEFTAVAMANYAGYGAVFVQAIDDNRSTAPISELVTLTCTALFFVSDLHVSILILIRESYVTPFPLPFGNDGDLTLLQAAFSRSFLLALQISAPLLVYSLIINFAFGVLNRLVPQIPIYFVSVPFVMVGGLLILLQGEQTLVSAFMAAVASWIEGLQQ